MTAAAVTTFEPDPRSEAFRWTVATAIILLAHMAVFIPSALLRDPAPGAQAEEPTITIDFAPPEVVLPAPTPPVEEQKPEEVVQPPPEPEAVTPPTPEEPPPDAPPKPDELALPPEKPAPPPPPMVAKPKVTQPVKKPPKPKPARQASLPQTAPNVGTASIGSSASQADWHGMLRAQLLRNKRYPSEAASNHETGSVVVSFTMDRSGRVLSRHVVRGSGYASLDQEALATIDRSQPLPAPPADTSPAGLRIAVPLNFTLH